MHRFRIPGMVIAWVAVGLAADAAYAAQFHQIVQYAGLIGDYVGNYPLEFHYLFGLSADGRVVVGGGFGPAPGNEQPYRWTPAGGLQWIDPFEPAPDVTPTAWGYSVSADGSFAFGSSLVDIDHYINAREYLVKGFSWRDGLFSELPRLPHFDKAFPLDASNDGTIVVGACYDLSPLLGFESEWKATRWLNGNPERLGELAIVPPIYDADSWATATSGDGSIVVGQSGHENDYWRPVVWENGSVLPLNVYSDPPDDMLAAYVVGPQMVWDISRDGSKAVGSLVSENRVKPVVWDVATRMPSQLPLPAEALEATAYCVSGDGTRVGGAIIEPSNWGDGRRYDFGGTEAILWRQPDAAAVRLSDLLPTYGLGTAIAGWHFSNVVRISGDGKILAGWGIAPNGNRAIWYVDLHNPPPNDRCASARDIREQPIVTPLLGLRRVSLGTLVDADDDGSDTCGGTGRPSVWFVFRAPVDGYLYADLCGSTIQNAVISVHADCPGGSANQIWCASDCADVLCGGPCLDPQWVPIDANQDYYIRVAGDVAGSNGTFRLTTQFYPKNDTCDQAYYIPVNQVTDGFTTRATIDTPPVCHEQNVTAPGVWYKVIGTGSTITATTCGDADFDTKISVYCGGCLNPLCIDANDDSDDQCGLPYVSRESTVQWCSAPGQVYHVLVHGFNDEVGSFGLDVTADSTLCGLTLNCAPPNDTCSGAIPIARDGSNLAATMLIDNNGASTGADATTCYGFEKDLWFSYIPECNGQLWVDTCQVGVGSAADTVVGVYDACGGNEIDCNDDYSDPSIDCGHRSNVIVPMYANQEVAIRVGTFPGTNAGTMPLRVTEVPGAIVFLGGNETLFQGASQVVHATVYGGCPPFVFTATDVPPGMTYAPLADDFSLTGTPTVAGDYTVHVDVCSRDPFNPECASGDLHVQVLPTNDACADAVPVSEGSFAFGNAFATTDGPDEPSQCDYAGYTDVGSDVWYRYTSSCSGIATADLCDSAYDTKVAVYDGSTCPLMASAIACNDDACGDDSLKSRVEFSVSEGESYLVRVGGYAEAQGAGRLTLTCFNDCNGNGVNDLIDNDTPEHADCNHNGRPDDCDLPGDFNGDGNLSIADYSPVYLCLSAVCPGPSCVPTLYFDDCCGRFDLDADGDVDLVDWAAYQQSFPLGHP